MTQNEKNDMHEKKGLHTICSDMVLHRLVRMGDCYGSVCCIACDALGKEQYFKIHHVVDDDLDDYQVRLRLLQKRLTHLKISRIARVVPAASASNNGTKPRRKCVSESYHRRSRARIGRMAKTSNISQPAAPN